MGDVTDLSSRRQEKATHAICDGCGGSGYFHVDVMILNADGSQGGYGGIPACARCGQLWTKGQPTGMQLRCGSCRTAITLPDDAAHNCQEASPR